MSSAKKLNEIECREPDDTTYYREEGSLMGPIEWMFRHRWRYLDALRESEHRTLYKMRRLEIQLMIWKLRYLRALRFGNPNGGYSR